MTEEKAPIEEYFPVNEVSEISSKETRSPQHYRPCYRIHKWWARRAGSVFRSIILYSLYDEDSGNQFIDTGYSSPQDLWKKYPQDIDIGDKKILEPFMGGGTTVVEGLRLGADVVGKELNPVAWFTVKKEVEDVDLEKLQEEYNKLRSELKQEYGQLYETECVECGHDAEAMNFFWIKSLECNNCSSEVDLNKGTMIASSRRKEDDYNWVYCPDCYELFQSDDYKGENECPSCKHTFVPDDGNATGKYYTCPDCGQKNETIDGVNRQGKPSEKLFAVEYYCKHCSRKDDLVKGKWYKAADKEDKKKVKEAKNILDSTDKITTPPQEVPVGQKTRELHNHGFTKFSDMFTPRQRLVIGKTFNKIKSIEEQNIKEFLALAASDALDFNNKLCSYSRSTNQTGHLFARHAYYSRNEYVENNFIGTEYGTGDFSRKFKMLKKAKEYCKSPFEKYLNNGKIEKNEGMKPIKGKFAGSFSDIESGEANTLIQCGDSSYQDIPDKSVDAIITDPPYFDNVMYSELADFYYVWLREILSDQYDYFNSEYTPKTSEVIKNKVQAKDEEDFTEMLTDVFSESRKKLKDDGIMAFTFHHKDTEAWGSVLGAVLDSQFKITSVYPVNSEMNRNMHIRDKGNIEYDMVVVCRKRNEDPEEGIWSEMRDRIYLEAKEQISELRERDQNLSDGDIFVITVGKCLQIYSEHYDNVKKDGEVLEVEEALESIREIVDLQTSENAFDNYVKDVSEETAMFLAYIAGKEEIDYSEINKEFQQRGLRINKLLNLEVVEKTEDKIFPKDPGEVAKIIKNKERTEPIEKAFYLIHLEDEDQLNEEMHDWVTDQTIKAMRMYGNILDEKDHQKLANYVEEKTQNTRLGDN